MASCKTLVKRALTLLLATVMAQVLVWPMSLTMSAPLPAPLAMSANTPAFADEAAELSSETTSPDLEPATADQATPDQATPYSKAADQATPDQTTPDQTTPNQATTGQADANPKEPAVLPLASVPTWNDALAGSLGYLYSEVSSPGYGDEWTVFALARGSYQDVVGETAWQTWTSKYLANLGADVNFKDKTGAIALPSPTDNERVVLALTALDIDASNWDGRDLVAPLKDTAAIDAQGVNAAYFALLALDSKNYLSADGSLRQHFIDFLISQELPTGGWDPWGFGLDADGTAQVITALAPYYTEVSTSSTEENTPTSLASSALDINSAVDKGLAALSGMQDASGAIQSWGAANANSTSQALIALSALQIDPTKDARFIKGNKTLIDGLLDLYNPKTGAFQALGYPSGVLEDNILASIDAAQALVAYSRLTNAKNSLFNLEPEAVYDQEGDPRDGSKKEFNAEATSGLPQTADNTATATLPAAAVGCIALGCLLIVLSRKTKTLSTACKTKK